MIINLAVLLTVIFLGYLVFETVYYNKIRKSFKHIIHVNGTRGKSTVTRLINAGLYNNGYKTFCKTTGTVPTFIDTHNREIEIKRKGRANIREQLKIMRKAYKEKAEILIIECMAVTNDIQYISQHQMLNADIVIITNARHDHDDQMGDTLESVADALSNVIPYNGKLIVGEAWLEDYYQKKAARQNTQIVQVDTGDLDINLIDYFEENIRIALTVGTIVGCNRNNFINGMEKYPKDPGVLNILRKKNTIFINGFSINDPDSTKIVYEKIVKQFNTDDLTILLNNRVDRVYRMLQQIQVIDYIKPKKVIICGDLKYQARKKIRKLQFSTNIEFLHGYSDLLNENLIFAIGNIANNGFKILSYFKEGN